MEDDVGCAAGAGESKVRTGLRGYGVQVGKARLGRALEGMGCRCGGRQG